MLTVVEKNNLILNDRIYSIPEYSIISINKNNDLIFCGKNKNFKILYINDENNLEILIENTTNLTRILFIEFLPNNLIAFANNISTKIEIWDIKYNEIKFFIETEHFIYNMYSDELYIYILDRTYLSKYDLLGNLINRIYNDTKSILMNISSNLYIGMISFNSPTNVILTFYNKDDLTFLFNYEIEGDYPSYIPKKNLTFSNDENLFVYSIEKDIYVFDLNLKINKLIINVNDNEIRYLKFSNDDSVIFCSFLFSEKINLYSTLTGELLETRVFSSTIIDYFVNIEKGYESTGLK